MENSTNLPNYGQPIINWQIPEYRSQNRTKTWYIGACIVAFVMLIYSFITANFLFSVIIIIAALVIILNDRQSPTTVNVSITTEGLLVGNKFYDYDEIKNFSFVYKPRLDIKNLYFEFKSPMKHRLTLPLDNLDPLPIKNNLLKYLPEDLERENIPFSESISRFLKL